MIPPKSSFFSFFGNLPPNNSGELTKKGNLIQKIHGIKNTLEVVAVYFLVKTQKAKTKGTIRKTRKMIVMSQRTRGLTGK